MLGGIAELIAGAISMGIGGFLASQAERDHFRYLQTTTHQRVKQSCAGEMEREVAEVLAPVGVDERTCREVARCLRDVEVSNSGYNATSGAVVGGRAGSRGDVESSPLLRWSTDVGLTAFLLKFGQGVGE